MKYITLIISLLLILIFPFKVKASICDGLTSVGECGSNRSCNWDDNTKTCYLNTKLNKTTTVSESIGSFNAAIGLDNNLTTVNGIISTFLPYILSFAGVILLFMLISGGFTMLTAVSNPEAADKGKQQITAALLGFILLFVSYWIIQILEIVLGINILGS